MWMVGIELGLPEEQPGLLTTEVPLLPWYSLQTNTERWKHCCTRESKETTGASQLQVELELSALDHSTFTPMGEPPFKAPLWKDKLIYSVS